MPTLIHIADERWLPDRWIAYCDTSDAKAHMQEDPAHSNCAACIEAYETRPQPVTTRDLLGVLRLAAWLAREGPPRTGVCPARAAAAKLEAKLARPRVAKPLPPQARCGKCQAPIADPDDDCQRCYPR